MLRGPDLLAARGLLAALVLAAVPAFALLAFPVLAFPVGSPIWARRVAACCASGAATLATWLTTTRRTDRACPASSSAPGPGTAQASAAWSALGGQLRNELRCALTELRGRRQVRKLRPDLVRGGPHGLDRALHSILSLPGSCQDLALQLLPARSSFMGSSLSCSEANYSLQVRYMSNEPGRGSRLRRSTAAANGPSARSSRSTAGRPGSSRWAAQRQPRSFTGSGKVGALCRHRPRS